MPSMVSSMGSTWMRLPYLTSEHCVRACGGLTAWQGVGAVFACPQAVAGVGAVLACPQAVALQAALALSVIMRGLGRAPDLRLPAQRLLRCGQLLLKCARAWAAAPNPHLQHGDHVAQAHAQVLAHHLVHPARWRGGFGGLLGARLLRRGRADSCSGRGTRRPPLSLHTGGQPAVVPPQSLPHPCTCTAVVTHPHTYEQARHSYRAECSSL